MCGHERVDECPSVPKTAEAEEKKFAKRKMILNLPSSTSNGKTDCHTGSYCRPNERVEVGEAIPIVVRHRVLLFLNNSLCSNFSALFLRCEQGTEESLLLSNRKSYESLFIVDFGMFFEINNFLLPAKTH